MSINIKKQPGVYKIECLVTGEIYIGSSRDIRQRKWDHFKTLRSGKQRNKNLLDRFTEYGELNIVFTPLVYLALEIKTKYSDKQLDYLLHSLEQAYMDIYQPTLNICPKAGTSKGFKQYDYVAEIVRDVCSKEFSFYNSDLGDYVYGRNLLDFAEANGLTRSCLQDVLASRSMQHENYFKDYESFLIYTEKRKAKHSTFNYVSWNNNRKQWVVSFYTLGKTLNFGYYEGEIEAGNVATRLSALKDYLGADKFYVIFSDYRRSKSYTKREWTIDKIREVEQLELPG